MHRSNNLQQLITLIVLIVFLVPAAEANTRKGDKLLKQGQGAEAKGDFDKALLLYEQAIETDQNDAGYLLAIRKIRFQAGQKHVQAGQKAREKGDLEGALAEFQRAVSIDPASAIAMQEMRRTNDAVMKKNGITPTVNEAAMTPGQHAKYDTEQKVASILGPPELKPITRQISQLKMNNQPVRVLYETVGKLAGINVVIDSQYQPSGRNFNVDLNNSSLESALDHLAILTHTFWKPINTNTIFIAEDNVTKRRDYEDEVVRVFYISNATSVQEFQEIATVIRSLTEIRRVFTYNAQRALLVRGTVDQIALVEKLVSDLDKPKGEVVVDVIVMQSNTSRTRDLAATLLSNGKGGLAFPVGFTPRNPVLSGTTPVTPANPVDPATGQPTTPTTPATGTTSTLVSLAQLGHISTNDFSTTLPGAILQAVLSDSRTRVLQSPQVRASDGMKVSLHIGQKIPYATGSFQPGVGSVGVSPLVSTQFNFAEVGVNVDMTPQIHGDDEVTLHIEIEISSVTDRIDLGGVSQPIIGQNKNSADIRLHEGEVNILAGLTQDQDSKTVGGIPGLTNIPILGHLFGTEEKVKGKSELLIAIIPHIIRTPGYSKDNLRGIFAGTDQQIKVNYREIALPTTPVTAPAMPVPLPSAPTPVVPVPGAVSVVPPGQQPPPPPPGSPAIALSFLPNSVQAQLSSPVTVALGIQNASDLFAAAPVKIKFDPKILRLNDVVVGEALAQGGQNPTFSRDIRNDVGEATFSITRLPGSGGVKATGTVVTLTFVAIGKGPSQVTMTEAGFKNSSMQPVVLTLPQLNVTVQ